MTFIVSLADGRQVIVRADPPAVGLPSTQPVPGQVVGETQSDRPTIVITHGWLPGETFTGSPPEWVSAMAGGITLRLQLEGKPAANIITYTWPEAFTPGIGLDDLVAASRFVETQGSNLALELVQHLGASYSEQIQFIGHSLGSMVNAEAVNLLTRPSPGFEVTQFTILDAPLDFTPYSDADFYSLLPPHPSVTWVDNYIATDKVSLTPGVGAPIIGAAPDGGLEVAVDHSGIHDWYQDTVTGFSLGEGFFYSAILGLSDGFSDRPEPQFWDPPLPAKEALSALADTVFEVSGEGWGIIEGTVVEIFQEVRGVFRDTIRLLETSDSAIALNLSIPAEATQFSFVFLFSNLGDGDWLTLSFNGNHLWSFLGESFFGADFLEATVPIGNFAGQSGVLQFTLHSTGDPNAQIDLTTFQFVQTGKAVTIDIKPRRDPNVINIRSGGKISVAILSTASFDAFLDVDQVSLTFGRTGDEESLAFCAHKARDLTRIIHDGRMI